MEGIVYLMEGFHKEYGIVYKIGYTTRSTETRLKELKTGNSSIELLSEYKTIYAKRIETTLHRSYSYKKIEGEWFNLNEDDVNYFIDKCKSMEKSFQILEEFDNPFF